jgi:hypothetical protein
MVWYVLFLELFSWYGMFVFGGVLMVWYVLY